MKPAALTQSERGSPAPRRHFDGWRLAPVVAFAWPILFFGDRVIPFRGTMAATGNDFIQLYWAYKAYLLDYLTRFSIPLWSPSEAAGYPFYANPFTQTYYPLNLPLAVFYALAGGYSPHDHQIYTAIGNALFALGMYLWLRSLGNGAPAALFAACVVSTSFRFADMLRFPNAVHTALWYPWVLLSFNRILGAPTRRELGRWLCFLCAFLLAFLTAGYPYYVYYSIFLFPPYLVLAASGGLGGVPSATRRRLGLITAVAALALALCFPYLAKVKQTLDATVGRDVAVDHPWYQFDVIDAVNSLVFPIGASPTGSYYFGAAGLMLLVLYLASIAGGKARDERRLCAVLITWSLFVSCVSLGKNSIAFGLLESVLPGFSRLRVWGRVSIVLLPLLAWLLARAFEHFAGLLAPPAADDDRRRRATSALLGALLVMCVVQGAQVFVGYVNLYYVVYLPELRGFAAWSMLGTGLAFLALRSLMVVARRRAGAGTSVATTVAVLLAVSALDVWPMGARMWTKRAPLPGRTRFDVTAIVRRSPAVPRRMSYSTLSLLDPSRPELGFSPAFSVGLLPDWYFRRYFDLVVRSPEREGLKYLLGGLDGQRLFPSLRIDHERIRPFLEDSLSFAGNSTIVDYTGDRMEAQVQMPAAGFVTFVDNWDPDWRALVDGKPAPLATVFGTFKAVAVPAGGHRVVFQYVPWS